MKAEPKSVSYIKAMLNILMRKREEQMEDKKEKEAISEAFQVKLSTEEIDEMAEIRDKDAAIAAVVDDCVRQYAANHKALMAYWDSLFKKYKLDPDNLYHIDMDSGMLRFKNEE